MMMKMKKMKTMTMKIKRIKTLTMKMKRMKTKMMRWRKDEEVVCALEMKRSSRRPRKRRNMNVSVDLPLCLISPSLIFLFHSDFVTFVPSSFPYFYVCHQF